MKEVKFRLWDNQSKIMRYNAMAGNYPDTVPMYWKEEDKEWYHIEYEHCEIMQYIGFKDRDGKEIYEGDIIEFRHNNGHMTKDYVMFENGRFTTGLGYNIHYFVMRRDGVKVIGNVYQDKGYKAYIDYPDGL